MRLLGEADAIKVISRQSGIATAGDYGSGLMIDGNLPSHVLYRIDGVPVYFPYRFGGIFSTFNAGHFSSVDFERGIHRGSMPSRLGAKVDFKTPSDIPHTVTGLANVGMMSSSFSIRVPAKKFSFALSGRVSYVNVFYGWLLLKDDSSVKYDFGDLNFTARYHPDSSNSLVLNLFGNTDRLYYQDDNYAMDTRINWKNGVASLEWRHSGAVSMSHRLYATYFGNRLKFEMPQLGISAPSSILSLGLSGEVGKWFLSDSFNIEGGYEFNYHDVRMQEVAATGFVTNPTEDADPSHPVDARVYADSRLSLRNGMRLDAGLSLSVYARGSGYIKGNVDPRITLGVPVPLGTFSIHLGRYSQYMHQVGFSQIGLASDFWIESQKEIPPEVSYNLELDYTGLIDPIDLYFSANVYGKRVLNQAELLGDFLSILDSDYQSTDYIYHSNGFAAGFNLNFRKEMGKLTGSLGIGYGIARQKFAGSSFMRSRTEPGFSLNAEVNYRFNSHWTAGGAFRYATGRPYTPITSLYLIGGNVMKSYGPPNSALLPAYHRLDLSATWSAVSGPKSHPFTHLVSLSLINAYGRKNPEFITYVIDISKGVVKMKQVASLYRFFPSLSYTLKF